MPHDISFWPFYCHKIVIADASEWLEIFKISHTSEANVPESLLFRRNQTESPNAMAKIHPLTHLAQSHVLIVAISLNQIASKNCVRIFFFSFFLFFFFFRSICCCHFCFENWWERKCLVSRCARGVQMIHVLAMRLAMRLSCKLYRKQHLRANTW